MKIYFVIKRTECVEIPEEWQDKIIRMFRDGKIKSHHDLWDKIYGFDLEPDGSGDNTEVLLNPVENEGQATLWTEEAESGFRWENKATYKELRDHIRHLNFVAKRKLYGMIRSKMHADIYAWETGVFCTEAEHYDGLAVIKDASGITIYVRKLYSGDWSRLYAANAILCEDVYSYLTWDGPKGYPLLSPNQRTYKKLIEVIE